MFSLDIHYMIIREFGDCIIIVRAWAEEATSWTKI